MHNTMLQEASKIIIMKYTMYNAFILTNYMPVSKHLHLTGVCYNERGCNKNDRDLLIYAPKI